MYTIFNNSKKNANYILLKQNHNQLKCPNLIFPIGLNGILSQPWIRKNANSFGPNAQLQLAVIAIVRLQTWILKFPTTPVAALAARDLKLD